MPESVKNSTSDLNNESWTVLAAAVSRLEQSWHSKSGSEFSEFIPAPDDPLRERVLVELIKVDQEFMWETGEQKFLEDYLSEWPELRGNTHVIAELLEAECLTRAVLESPLTGEELASRYPGISDQIDLAQIRETALKENRSSRTSSDIHSDGDERAKQNTNCPPTSSLQEPTLKAGGRFGRYKIIEVLGTGGMGTVYRSLDTHLNREVALKIPSSDLLTDHEAVSRFLREAQAAAKVEHPNVCMVFNADEIEGTPYITMMLVNGPTLDCWIQGNTTDLRKIATITLKLAQALAKVHSQGIVHRDIKPSNVVMKESGEPLLMDFGLARTPDHDALLNNAEEQLAPVNRQDVKPNRDNFSTGSDAFLGTLLYMSPQQVNGQPADYHSDIYSLGVLLYQMLTGRPPFSGNFNELITNITKSKPLKPSQVLSTIDSELEGICLKAMEKEPADRYQSANEMALALQQYLEDSDGQPPQRHSSRWTIAAGAMAVMLLAGVTILLKTGNGTLELEVPHDAVVKIDGRIIDTTAANTINATGAITLTIPVGKHELEASKEGQSVKRSFTIRWRWDTARASAKLDEAVVLLATVEQWIETPGSNLLAMSISKDGSTLVVPTRGGKKPPILVDIATGKTLEFINFDPPADITDVVPDKPHDHKAFILSDDGRYLYLTNYYSRHISRIDCHNKNTTRHLSVGELWAGAIGISPDKKKLVVTLGQDGRSNDEKNDQIAIVDITEGRFQLLDTVPLNDEPINPNIGFSSDSQYAYVVTLKRRSAQPTLYETRLTGPHIVTRTLSFSEGELRGVAVSSKHKRVFVSDSAHRKIWVVNLGNFKVSGEIELFGHAPGALALNADESLLIVLCPKTRKLVCVEPATGATLGGASGLDPDLWEAKFTDDDRRLLISHTGNQARIASFRTSHLLNRIVFASNREGGGYQLYVMAMDRNKLLRLTQKRSTNRSPRWSPDGTQIAFFSDVDGPNRVCIINRDGSGLRVLKNTDPVLGSTGEASIDWSPDGKKIAFVGNGNQAVRAVNIETGEVDTLLNKSVDPGYAHHNGLSWSSARGNILFNSQDPKWGKDQDILSLDPEKRQVSQITNAWGRPPYYISPASSPDGAIIVAVFQSATTPRNLVLIDANGKNPTQLTRSDNVPHANPRWFPDGQRVIFSAGMKGHQKLFWIRTNGTGLTQLTDGDGDDIEPDIWGRF